LALSLLFASASLASRITQRFRNRSHILDMSITAIILAAGRSSRMGAFKPLLPWGTQTVIDTCVQSLREGGADSVIVVVGYRADAIRQHLVESLVTFAENPDPTSQMNDSIQVAVAEIPTTSGAVIITPVDYPAVSAGIVSALICEWSKGFHLVKPTHHGRGGHPVLIDLSLRSELENLDSTNGLKGLFERNNDKVKRLEVDSPYIARDIDTWDDYRALHAEVLGFAPPERSEDFSNEKRAGLI
jgi:molybdenum cofactor cytidylyltransferase